jgi:hypothetical protein
MASLGIVAGSAVCRKRQSRQRLCPKLIKGPPTQKVLLADDYADMRKLLGRQIESLGFLPILAADGKDVLDKAIRRKAAVDPDGPDDAGNGWLGSGAKSSRQPGTKAIPARQQRRYSINRISTPA